MMRRGTRPWLIAVTLIAAACVDDGPLAASAEPRVEQQAARTLPEPTQPGAVPVGTIRICRRPIDATEPLLVVNGTIMTSASTTVMLNQLDPILIDSIFVLKGAAATARYGSRASAGVITVFSRQTDLLLRR